MKTIINKNSNCLVLLLYLVIYWPLISANEAEAVAVPAPHLELRLFERSQPPLLIFAGHHYHLHRSNFNQPWGATPMKIGSPTPSPWALAVAHTLYALHEPTAVRSIPQLWFEVNRLYPQAMQLAEFSTTIADTCFAQRRDLCLADLLRLPIAPQERSQAFTYRALLADDPLTTRDHLAAALKHHRPNPQANWLAQYFSVQLANKLLEAYQDEHRRVSIFRRLGMNTAEDGDFTFFDALREASFNTGNVIAVLFTDYDEALMEIWQGQVEALARLKNSAAATARLMREQRLTVEQIRQNLADETFYDGLDAAQQWQYLTCKQFINSPYCEQISQHGLYQADATTSECPLPQMREVGFEDDGFDFVDTSLKDFFISQCNLGNVLLAGGPATAKVLANTAVGKWFLAWSGLSGVVLFLETKLALLPAGLAKYSGVGLAVAIHLADGQEIYTGYLIYKGSQTVGPDLPPTVKQSVLGTTGQ